MRGYDDYGDEDIRLNTPVLQRVIILTAVIVAVPVLMWTVTAFVRSYIARPLVPAVQHVAAPESPTRAPAPGQVASNPASSERTAAVQKRGDAEPPPSDARGGTPEIAMGPPNAPPSPNGGVAAAPTAPPPVQSAAMPAPAAAAGARSTTDVAAAGSAAAPPVSTATPAGPAPLAAQAPPAQAPSPSASSGSASSPPAADGTTVAAASGAADRGAAWPNANATSPPDFAAPAATAPPRTASVEIVPPGAPIAGPIPLPRQRPGLLALAGNTAGNLTGSVPANTAASVTGSTAARGPIPLPRVRPSAAPAPVNAPNGYHPGLGVD